MTDAYTKTTRGEAGGLPARAPLPVKGAPLLLTSALVALYVAARLWGLTAGCLWFDEIFGVHAARHTWGGLWSFAAADLIHPPLFYALLKIWTAAGGESLLWVRLFPVVVSVAALAPFFLLARELRLSASEVNAALLLAAANGYLIKYAQEVRMYGLLMLFSLFSLWLFVKLINAARASRGLLVALAASNLLLVYAHYYGWLLVACEAAYLVFKDRRKLPAFLLSCAAVATAFAPWALACARAAGVGGGGLAQNIGWIERPGLKDAAGFFALLHGPFHFRQSSAEQPFSTAGAWAGFALIGLPVALVLLRAALRRRRGDAERDAAGVDEIRRDGALWFLSFFVFVPVASALAASHALPHAVWGTRHLIAAAAPYLLLAGVALWRLRPFWLKASALMLLGCWILFAGAFTLLGRGTNFIWCAWEGLAASAASEEARLSSSEGAGTPDRRGAVNVYAFEDLVAYHLWFALGEEGGRRMKVVVLKGFEGVAEDPAYFLPRRFDGVGVADSPVGERFWAALRDTSWDESRPPLKTLLARGYRAERIYEAGAQGQRAFLVLFTRGKE